jgi:hypothetical protein
VRGGPLSGRPTPLPPFHPPLPLAFCRVFLPSSALTQALVPCIPLSLILHATLQDLYPTPPLPPVPNFFFPAHATTGMQAPPFGAHPLPASGPLLQPVL